MQTAKQIQMYPTGEAKDVNTVSYVPIKRQFFNHWLWTESRVFSKCEAWLDLIQSARFEQSQASKLIGGKLIKWCRGQLPASVRFLSQKWNWGKHKVEDFLKLLKEEGMISIDSGQGQTIITLLNYEAHNSDSPSRGQQRGHQKPRQARVSEESGDTEGDKWGTPGGHRGDETNKDNNENKEEEREGASAPPAPAQTDFEKFQRWVLKYSPRVAQMKEPFTEAQYLKVKDTYNGEEVKDVLKAMHNKASLLKDYVSAYATLTSWLKLREKNGTATTSKSHLKPNGHHQHPTAPPLEINP